MKFLIEHMESKLHEWCMIEYAHISKIVGKKNLIFANIKNKKERAKLKKYGAIYEKSLAELKLGRICVLSQYANKELVAKDKKKFEYFVFGGILGDNPARKRTNEIINDLKKGNVKFEQRSLGTVQMPTDNAVYAAKKILDGLSLRELKFIDEVEIEINENESVNLSFRYIVDNNKLVISDKLVEHLRKRREF